MKDPDKILKELQNKIIKSVFMAIDELGEWAHQEAKKKQKAKKKQIEEDKNNDRRHDPTTKG